MPKEPAPEAAEQQEPNQQESAQQELTQPVTPTRYRFTTQDGQTHESTQSPQVITEMYPGAAISHTVETDATTGESTLVPYGGEGGAVNGQPEQADTAEDTESAEPTQESSSNR